MLRMAMLSTGEEVLHGDIVDTNAAWLAEFLFTAGFPLIKRATVGDSQTELIRELKQLSHDHQIVIVNGGLGPTSDDLSAEAAALANGDALRLFPEWLEQMESFFASRHIDMPSSNIKQAMLPASATIIDNPIGTACGFALLINQCVFYFTPGVPSEFKRMVQQQILPDIQRRYPQQKGLECHRFYTFGSSESALSELVDSVTLPEGYMIGYRAYLPFIEVKLFGPKGDARQLTIMEQIQASIETYVVCVNESITACVARKFVQQQLSLAICDGGSMGYLAYQLLSETTAKQWCRSYSMTHDHEEQKEGALSLLQAQALELRELQQVVLSLVIQNRGEHEVSLLLATPQGEWGQTLHFRRSYQQDERHVLVSTFALDMLRRYLEQQPVWGQYGSVERVATLSPHIG